MGIDIGSTTAKMVILDKDNSLVFSRYRRHNAHPAGILTSFFEEAQREMGDIKVSATVTGSVGMGVAENLQIPFMQEVSAATQYTRYRYPEASALIASSCIFSSTRARQTRIALSLFLCWLFSS